MVKNVLSVRSTGLRDWVTQRVSAIYMAVYSIGLLAFILCHSPLSFFDWHDLFTLQWMKIATLIFIVCALVHAWLGMWTIFTDYVKPFVIRAILNSLVLLMLIACFFWGVLILWSV